MPRPTATRHVSPNDIVPPSAERIPTPDAAAIENDVPDWRRPSNLEMPPARPGFVQRLVRTGVGNSPDATNVARKLREGWRPRLKSTVQPGYSPPTIQHGTLGEVIGVGELVLMEMPRKTAKQKREYIDAQTAKQMQGVEENLLRIERPGIPIERDRRSRVEGPRKAEINDD